MNKVNFNEIFSASAEKIKELLDNSVIFGSSSDQIFYNGECADDLLVIKRYVNILPGTLAPAACKTGVDMGNYVRPNADSVTRQDLLEELKREKRTTSSSTPSSCLLSISAARARLRIAA